MDRWEEIDEELQGIAEGKVVDGDPAAMEEELLQELDRLEWEAGEQYFRERDQSNGEEEP